MPNIAMQRLSMQQIQNSMLKTPAEVVRHLGVIQAQDYAGAMWSIGLRLPGSTEADIEQALADKTFVRSWILRGTLHFAAAEDVRWMLVLVGEQLIKGMARRHQELDLDAPTLSRSHDIISRAMQEGQAQTRKALFALLQENGVSTAGQRGIHILSHASLHSLICQTAVAGNQDATFMLLDDAVPPGKAFTRDEALAELAKRYFFSRAPATLQDFAWWSGLPMADVRAGLDAIQAQLEQVTIDGKTYYQPRNMPDKSTESVYLLPGFDEYLISYRDRSASLDAAHAQKVVPGGNGIFMPTIVINGRVVGLWKRVFKKGSVMMTFAPFEALTGADMQAVAKAAEPYGSYLQMPVVMG